MAARRSTPGTDSVCCERCFQDRVLVHKIREEGTNGSCPWCGASDVKVLPVAELGDLFRDLARNYAVAEDDRGEWIDQLFQEDWELFADDKYVSVRRHDLTLAILESGLDPKDDVMDYPAYEDQFVRLQTSPVDLLGQWENRVAEMFEHTDTDAGPTPLESGSAEMLDYIADAVGEVGAAYPQNRPLYRARTHDQRGRRERFSLAEMGAPPPDVTLGGRANRAREPVLYMASDPHTALAEKRAWKGAVVAIATMKLISPVRILDLKASQDQIAIRLWGAPHVAFRSPRALEGVRPRVVSPRDSWGRGAPLRSEPKGLRRRPPGGISWHRLSECDGGGKKHCSL